MPRIRARALGAIAVIIALAGCGGGDRAARTASHHPSPAAGQAQQAPSTRVAARSRRSRAVKRKANKRRSRDHVAAKDKGPPAIGPLAKEKPKRRPRRPPTAKAALRSLPGG